MSIDRAMYEFKALKVRRIIFLLLFGILLTGFIIPENFTNPVVGSTSADYNEDSFWYYPWGKSVTHKGVDIFAKKGAALTASTDGLVLYSGEIEMGGKIILLLGPKWRLHYCAHLDSLATHSLTYVSTNEHIGTVGDSGNAKGKAPHLHYSIITLFPYLWRVDFDKQGWKKAFYLNPIPLLQGVEDK